WRWTQITSKAISLFGATSTRFEVVSTRWCHGASRADRRP
ncbi:MAG: hypothetical protein AVDCRST_MAG66-4856, partial [uncultured Pseudonocardia sp.]